MRVFGAYPTAAVEALHDPARNFHVCGHAASLEGVLTEARVLLAPLRFGAGIKGKIVDAWRYGLPVVATEIGAEGMKIGGGRQGQGGGGGGGLGAAAEDRQQEHEENDAAAQWGGVITEADAAAFAAAAVRLYSSQGLWDAAQRQARCLLRVLYDRDANLATVRAAVEATRADLPARRCADYASAMLWHHNARSTEFFS
eukprot:g6280.t1